MEKPDPSKTSRRLPAEERKAHLDQQVTAAVAQGGRVQWWGGDSFQAVVSHPRYLPGRAWGYFFPLALLGLPLTWLAAPGVVGIIGFVLAVGVVVGWVARSSYERISVDEQGVVRVAGAGLLGASAGLTLAAGLTGAIPGLAHFQGVVSAASTRGYAYDARLAGLLILGIGMVFAGILCLTAVRGLAHGRRPAWERALVGSLLLVLVTLPIVPIPAQGDMAAVFSFPAWVNLIVLPIARRQLETG